MNKRLKPNITSASAVFKCTPAVTLWCCITFDMPRFNHSLHSPSSTSEAATSCNIDEAYCAEHFPTMSQKTFSVMFGDAKAIKRPRWVLEAFHLAKQSGDVVFQQCFQLPDSITPTHLTFWSPDKYLCSTAVPIHPTKKYGFCLEIFAQLVYITLNLIPSLFLI